jgi:predicted dehydrogenase
VAQKRAQLQDAILVEGGEVEGREFKSAEDYGYQDAKIEDYDRPAMEELIRWRLWNRTGGGLMAELGSHQLDAASIFIAAMHGGEKQHPLTVSASASRSIFPRDRDVDDHVVCLYEYAAPGYDKNDPLKRKKRISVAYASINGNGFGGYGETVYGTEGTLLLEREKDALLYKTAAVNDKTIVQKNRDGKKELHRDEEGDPLSAAIGVQGTFAGEISRGYTEELEHWAYCIRNNPDASDDACMPKCHPKIALGDAVIALTTNIAARTGETIEFQEAWFDPDDDATPDDEKPDLSQYE